MQARKVTAVSPSVCRQLSVHLSLAQKAPHLTPLSRAPDRLSLQEKMLLGLGRADASMRSLSLLSLLPVPFPPQALITLSTRGKLPSLQKRECSSLGSISIPIETAQTHQNGDTSIPDQTIGPSFFSSLTSFFVLFCFLMHSLGQSKYKSKV